MIRIEQVYDNDFINSFMKSIDWSKQQIESLGVSLDTLQTHHLFHIHNVIAYPNHGEWSKSCSACRLRVYKKMMIWYGDQPFKTFTPKYLSGL